jgi:hypothetical protein
MKHQRNVVMVIAILAMAQGIFGILRALDWVRIGADLTRQGLLFTPMIGLVAIARGWVVAVILNALLVVNALTGGATYGRAVIWLIVPIIVLIYLFSKAGRRDLAGQSNL